MVWAPSFSQLYLWIQPLLQSPPKILPLLWLTSLFYPYFFIKSSLQSLLSFPSAIPQQFSTSLFFAYNHPGNLHQKYFPYFNHLAKSGYVRRPRSYGVLWGMTLFQSLPSFSKYWQWKQDCMLLSCHVRVSEWTYTL